ncbi:MAG: T9SS C-terminal target domain-containing protein [Ignavibacteriae bacterium]|nr:MAG: T9SS C-terminal target domain-containing protein [Ignavibacteriota bacterium]
MKKILLFTLLVVSQNIFPQGFIKITSGPVVNDGGWCYGGCWADFNNDGKLDLFVCNNNSSNKNNFLYLNNGNGTFTKVTSGVIVNDGGSSYGCTAGDYDNDGNMDLFVTNYGENNFLYHGNGDGTFTKITTGNIVSDGGNSVGCSWGDYDNDGKIDLFVCNRNQNNFLYHNNGSGTFTKITSGAIVTDNSNSGGCAWGDYNNDGFIDLFVANAGPAVDFLYQNNGNGTFTKITTGPVVTESAHSSGGSWGDYDNDGDLDLLVTCGVVGTGYNRLFMNNGDGSFTKITADPIATYNHWAGGSSWGDIDNDGDIDLFIGGYDGINLLFTNNGNGSFTRIDTGSVVNDGSYKMGAMFGDYDNDGDLDLFTARNNYFGGNNTLYMNTGNSNKQINIKCVGMISNKAGIGAKVFVRAIINGTAKRQMQVVSSQTGGANSGMNSLNAEFGLGNATIIDSVIIKWPSGVIDKYTNVGVNQFVTAIEGQGMVEAKNISSQIPGKFMLNQNYPNPFNPKTIINYQLPMSSDVKLKIYDVVGREVDVLINQKQNAGTYEVEWNASNYPGGVYFYKIFTNDFSETKKMVLIK